MATTAELFEVGPGAPRAAAGEGREWGRCPRDAGPARVAGRPDVLETGRAVGRADSGAQVRRAGSCCTGPRDGAAGDT